MSKKFIRGMCIFLAVLMLLGVLFSVLSSITALAAVSQADIEALENERQLIRDKQADVKEQLDALQSDMTFILDKKAVLDEQNELKRQEIEIIDGQITAYDELIREKAAELAEAEKAERQQYERYCERLRAMEENSGSWWYLSYIFKAGSFASFLSRIDDVMDIMRSDLNLEAEYTAAREHVEAVKAEYEDISAQLELKKDELTEQKAGLEEDIKAACEMIKALEDDIDTYTAFYEENELLEAEVQAKIDALVQKKLAEEEARRKAEEEARRKAEEERQKNNNNNNNNSSGNTGTGGGASSGYYSWPCPSSAYITSKFGWRIHPIFGTQKYHSGVDIAANSGANICAAAGGTVSIAEYSSSYGNYVVLYHSNGTTTLYAHMSSMAVSAGQTVKQGDIIGYVGSTGNSTGPHLHFEVRVNGSCVDPLQYYTKMSFSYASDA